MMMGSKNVAPGAKPPSSLPPVKKITPGVGKEPLRVKPSGITAKPKGGKPSTAWDKAALADKGMTPRGVLPRSPFHHLIPQELLENPDIKRLLERRKIDIDDFSVQLSEGEYTAIHSMEYNKKWSRCFKETPNATKAEIFGFMNRLRKEYKINDLPIQKYQR